MTREEASKRLDCPGVWRALFGYRSVPVGELDQLVDAWRELRDVLLDALTVGTQEEK